MINELQWMTANQLKCIALLRCPAPLSLLPVCLVLSPLCHALSLNAFCLCLRFTSNFYATLNIYIGKKIVKNLASASEGALKEASVAGRSSSLQSAAPSPFCHSSLIMLSEVWLAQAQANYRDWYSVAAHTAEISLSQSRILITQTLVRRDWGKEIFKHLGHQFLF